VTFTFWKSKYRSACAIAIASFSAGALVTAGFGHVDPVNAQSDRVFELRIYHTVPGKLPAMESRFRDATSGLLAKHHLNVVGYWTADSTAPGWDNTLVFLLAHSSREEAKKNWEAMGVDPAFQELIRSEQRDRLLGSADTVYMTPTDFSPMK
jgi:hypothetical protein